MQAEMLDSVVSSNSQELSNASSAIKLFENPLFKARVIMRCSDPWFVAKDVADSIEHSNVTKMCELCRDKDKVTITDSKEIGVINESLITQQMFSKNTPNVVLISESGLYRILAKCNLPKCEPFESWVFDEVLPSIRKTGGYSVQPTLAIPKTLPEALRAYADEVERREAAEKRAITAEVERDEAVRTKAQIGSSREATAMNTASQKSKECEKLREQIGDSKTYKRATAIPWLSEYFDTRNDGLYNSLASQLKKIEASMPPEFAHKPTPDSRYGSVKAYHIAVIDRLHEIVREKLPVDKKFMAKYRKDVSSKSENV